MEAIAPSGRVVRLTPELIERCIQETAEKPDAIVKKRDNHYEQTSRMMKAMSRHGHRDSASWESAWVMRDLENDEFELILDCMKRGREICQATNCLIENLSERHGARIYSSCRFHLRSTSSTRKKNTRCYHVHCFEAIVEDPARFVKPVQVPNNFAEAYLFLPSALNDWVTSGGFVHELGQYNDIKLTEANKNWRIQWFRWHTKRSDAVHSGNQD